MLEVRGLDKVYRQGGKDIHAVSDAGLRVEAGRRIYVHGPSGAGKSTLLHMLGGLDMPTKGTVLFGGKDIYRLSDGARSRVRNRHFGFIFQFYHLLPELNVLENVMLPAMIRGGESRSRIAAKAEELIEKAGMSGRVRHRPSELSGGEAQRAAVARSLINSPDILFCDEPTGNLDSEMSSQIYALIRDVSVNSGMSVVLVSHQEVAEDLFDEEYYMKDGVLRKMPARGGVRVPE